MNISQPVNLQELILLLPSSRASINAYNAEVETFAETRNEQIAEILGDKNQAFRDWVSNCWSEEREFRNTATVARADIDRVSNIWQPYIQHQHRSA